jgi:hypothetical protein
VAAAHALGAHVVDAHINTCEQQAGQWRIKPVHAAPEEHPALRYLPAGAPRVIEFPIPAPTPAQRRATLRDYIDLVRSGDFAE